MKYFSSVLLCFMLVAVDSLTASGEKNDSNFVATHEWQVVKKGQPIPSGLHVRHNFKTGVTEAKLLDKDDVETDNDKAKSLALHTDAVPNNFESWLQEWKKINKERKNEKMKQSFRSYEELKEDFKAMEMNVTTDSHLITILFQRFKAYEKSIHSGVLQDTEVERLVHIFDDFEFLLHQIDNAQLFADMDGMARIISPCLNTSNEAVKMEALRVLGTAVQSNPKVQSKALNNDLVQKMLQLLTVNPSTALQSRCLFALGALLRQFPAAQKTFIDHGGLEVFGTLLEDGQLVVQLRVMKLITDLATERKNIIITEDKSLLEQKTLAYGQTGFEEKLVLHKYCKSLANIVKQSVQQSLTILTTVEIFDFLQVTFDNMIAVSATCKYEFRSKENTLIDAMKALMDHYGIINDTRPPEETEMFENLAKQISKLQILIYEDAHDEL